MKDILEKLLETLITDIILILMMENHIIILVFHLNYRGKLEEAFDAFYKSTWNAALQDSGYLFISSNCFDKADFNEHWSMLKDQ